MRWILAGITFALAVVMAIGTAALRAENTRRRHDEPFGRLLVRRLFRFVIRHGDP